MLTKRTVTSLAALLETHLFRSNLAADWGRKFSADEYISQILGACERCHGGAGAYSPGPLGHCQEGTGGGGGSDLLCLAVSYQRVGTAQPGC